MRERMDKQSQDRILDALDTVADLVDEKKMSPNDALTKVAMEKQLPPGHIRLMVTAFNTGRANHHRKKASNVLDKASPITMASAEQILENLYPSKVKSAAAVALTGTVSGDYNQPFKFSINAQPMEKAASYDSPLPPPLPSLNFKREKQAFNALRDYQKVISEKELESEKAKLHFIESYKVACETVRLLRPSNWNEIRDNMEVALGKDASVVLKHIDAANRPFVKSANEKKNEPVDMGKAPYREIHQCVISMRTYRIAKSSEDKAKNDASFKKLKDKLLPDMKKCAGDDKKTGIIPFGSLMDSLTTPFKETFTATAGGVGGAAADTFLPNLDADKSTKKVFDSISSPEHDNKLNSIKVKAVVNDMLTNDPVISEYDPDEVIKHFNEINQLAPRLMSEPAAVRVLLRKSLAQGGIDTHEIKQIGDTELSLRRSRETPGEGIKYMLNPISTK